MSWFDTSGLANMAKSALKEAQKTIDKALDITDEEGVDATTTSNPIDVNNEDFFSTWGIGQSSNNKALENTKTPEEIATKSLTKGQVMPVSIWGSFTGSFFENQKSLENDLNDDSIDMKSIDEKFKSSKLVVQASTDETDYLKSADSTETLIEADLSDVVYREDNAIPNSRKERTNSAFMNRLSAISSESGKNSSESVEVLNSGSTCGTGCTTTPESEAFSQSVSASADSKKDSDSVEVLPDSLTSPSSIEVIPESAHAHEQVASNRWSQLTENELLSPLDQSPPDTTETNDTMTFYSVRSTTKDINTPDSIEIIQGQDQDDECSAADDTMSYTSLSETSTAATIMLEASKRPKLLKDMTESITSDLSLSPDRGTFQLALGADPPITKGPSRSALHLPLAAIATQPHISVQNLSSSGVGLSGLLEQNNVIDIPETDCDADFQQNTSSSTSIDPMNDESSQSDRTLIATDSEAAVMESSSDTSTTTDSNSNSFYLKNMLADAMTDEKMDRKWIVDMKQNLTVKMQSSCQDLVSNFVSVEKSSQPLLQGATVLAPVPASIDAENTGGYGGSGREAAHSPMSSESRSDLVKIGSEQTSEHTSGDELETTASSDIEIISSPNGDSSSTQSRQSPAKLTLKGKEQYTVAGSSTTLGKTVAKKMKGHTRELSEASSYSDDGPSTGNQLEIDRLLKRLADMTEILETRETKLIETSRRNAELQETNAELRQKLDSLAKRIQIADLSQVSQEDYTQRLSALEKKFQQTMREKEQLKKQLDSVKSEAATRMSKNELETLIREKDETIMELREEGEKLSKQQLQHSNIIKKLRSKEKEHETCISHLKSRVEELSSETERLKRSLTAKEEVERSQIEAINQLTAKNRKLEQQSSNLQSQLDDSILKMETSKGAFEAARKELQEHARTHAELLAREKALTCLENEKKLTDSQNEEVINQLEDLRLKLRHEEQEYLKKEQQLRLENSELLRRLEGAEARNEQLTQSVSQATKPLVRQLEALQATYSMKTNAWEKTERDLLLKLAEAQTRVAVLSENDRSAKEECLSLRSRFGSLETQLSTAQNQVELLKTQLEQSKTERELQEKELRRESENLQRKLNNETVSLENIRKACASLEHQISVERAATEAEKRKNAVLQEQLQEKENAVASSGTTSPTLSLGRLSFSESLGSGANWVNDDISAFDFTSAAAVSSNRFSNSMFEVQSLHSNLKQKDGEVQQLQWELKRREQERTYLNTEISSLITKLEDAEVKLGELLDLKGRFEDLQQKYDALCLMYGEKVEETEELRLDLQDVKEMYKTQIDQLMNKAVNG